jgi:hypothetical protein
MKKREEVQPDYSKIGEMINMRFIAGRKRPNVIGPHHPSLTQRACRLIRYCDPMQLLDTNQNNWKPNTGC